MGSWRSRRKIAAAIPLYFLLRFSLGGFRPFSGVSCSILSDNLCSGQRAERQHKGDDGIDRMRFLVSGNVNCLVTSNGYGMIVNSSGVTTLEPGSAFLGPGVYPDIALGLY
jgi:hypothetical protein